MEGNHSMWPHRMVFVIKRGRYIKILNLDLDLDLVRCITLLNSYVPGTAVIFKNSARYLDISVLNNKKVKKYRSPRVTTAVDFPYRYPY